MPIYKTVKAVERLYKELEVEQAKIRKVSQLQCPSGCIKCCLGKNVTAAPLEFLPYAYSLYKSGELEDSYWAFKSAQRDGCLLLDFDEGTQTGKCGAYLKRGLVCRLFGAASRIDKNGGKAYIGCTILKDELNKEPEIRPAVEAKMPIAAEYYTHLRGIDVDYGSMLLPVNLAIIKALEIVYHHTRRYSKQTV
jgi:uncharacterized protein